MGDVGGGDPIADEDEGEVHGVAFDPFDRIGRELAGELLAEVLEVIFDFGGELERDEGADCFGHRVFRVACCVLVLCVVGF